MPARRILVVEDEAAVRELVSKHLTRKGYAVTQASDAEQVLLRMSRDRDPYDLVLSDIHLPGLSGVELLRLLMAHSPLRPVIMITGDADESLARRALGYGATGYLLKPFQLFELDAAVQQALARLELVEAAGRLARSPDREGGGGAGPGTEAGSGGAVPPAWLELADRRSSGGSGHGHRVARLASGMVGAASEGGSVDRRALDLAARAHELGRLLGPAAGGGELATRTSQLLYDLGVDPAVLRLVGHVRERWDGAGGPKGLSGSRIPLGSRILAAADMLDHAAVAYLEAGAEPGDAVARGLAEVREVTPAHFGPEVADALAASAGVLEAVWVLARGPIDMLG